jgi:hypothetical protein
MDLPSGLARLISGARLPTSRPSAGAGGGADAPPVDLAGVFVVCASAVSMGITSATDNRKPRYRFIDVVLKFL